MRDVLARHKKGIWFFLWLVLGVLYVFVNRAAFQSGWMSEDFAWLWRVSHSDLGDILQPMPDAYYRPLATNIPYFLFSRIHHGFALWRLLALLVLFGCSLLLWDLLRRYTDSRFAFVVALSWLISPRHYPAIFYANAFDYALFPLTLCAFCWALGRGKGRLAVLSFVIALLAKELALVLVPFLFWHLHKKRRRGALLAAFSLLAAALAIRGGSFMRFESLGSVNIAGFGFSLNAELLARNLGLLLQKFYRDPVDGRAAFLWNLSAWLFLGIAFAQGLLSLWRKKGFFPENFQRSVIFMALALLLPFLFLRESGSIAAVSGIWVLLFCFAAPFIRSRRMMLAVSLLLLHSIFMGLNRTREAHLYYQGLSRNYFEVLKEAERFTGHCPPGAAVRIAGLEKAFLFNGENSFLAEHAVWALRWYREDLDWKLEGNGGAKNAIPGHESFYENEKAPSQGPKIIYHRSQDGHVTAEQNGTVCRR